MFVPVKIPPLEDELMYSWIERMSHANGFGGTEASALRLFSKHFIHPNSGIKGVYEPHYDCHDDVGAFLLSVCPLNKLADIYLNTNVYNGIAPFMSQMRQTNYINRSVYPNIIGFEKLIHKYANSLIKQAYICPECVEEDIKLHGFYYLHRAHHLPGVKCCYKHNCELLHFEGTRSHELESVDLYTSTDDVITDADIQYAKFYKDFLDLRIDSTTELVALAVRKKINNMGYLKPDYQKLTDKLISDGYGPLFYKDLKRFLDNNLTGMRGNSFDFKMIAGLLCATFDSVHEFASYIETDDNKKEDFYDNILKYNYSLIGSYTPHIVVLKNNANNNVFMTSPHGFNIGWRDPIETGALSEDAMYKTIVNNLTKGEYSVMSDFISTDFPVTMRHNVCNREYEVRAGSFLIANNRCVCEKNLTFERAQKRIDEITNNEYELLRYTTQHDDATFVHKICGTKITKLFSVMYRAPSCPVCTPKLKQRRRKEYINRIEQKKQEERSKKRDRISKDIPFKRKHDEEHFILQIKALVGEEYKLIGNYNALDERVEMLHGKCGEIFTITPKSFLQGRRCKCCEMLKGAEFAHYVEHVSRGRYEISSKSEKGSSLTIVDKETNTGKVLGKSKIAQELYRPTASSSLPCANRRMDLSPYIETNTTKVLNVIKKQFGEKDIFAYAEIDTSETALAGKQIREAISNLIKNGKLYQIKKGWYCRTNYDHSPVEVAHYMYCERNGHRIGVFRGCTLIDMLANKENAEKYYVRSNIVSKYEKPSNTKDVVIAPLKSPIHITDNNYPLVVLLGLS